MNTSEARRAVSEIAHSEEIQIAARSVAEPVLQRLGGLASEHELTSGDAPSDADLLKIAEFGLFVEPISRGVEDFVENAGSLFSPGEPYGIKEVSTHIGMHIYDVALGTLRQDNTLDELAQQLADMRASLASSPMHAGMLAPLTSSLRSAAGSSVNSMINVALANAYAIHQSREDTLPAAELVTVVRHSTQLALAIPMVHLLDLTTYNILLSAHNYGNSMGRGYPDHILRTNPDTHVVSTAKPLQEWRTGPALTIGETSWKNGDVRIGCPFSFAP